MALYFSEQELNLTLVSASDSSCISGMQQAAYFKEASFSASVTFLWTNNSLSQWFFVQGSKSRRWFPYSRFTARLVLGMPVLGRWGRHRREWKDTEAAVDGFSPPGCHYIEARPSCNMFLTEKFTPALCKIFDIVRLDSPPFHHAPLSIKRPTKTFQSLPCSIYNQLLAEYQHALKREFALGINQ